LVAGLGLTAALAFAALWLEGGRGEGPQRIIHAQLAPPEGMAFGDTFALSPDGRHIVFEAYDQKTRVRALWVRSMDRGEASRLGPTDGGELPFWSPDGAHVGFFAEGKLKRVDLQSGSAQVICDAPTPRGGAWGPDGRIVFTDSFRTGLSIVPAAGGEARTLTTLDASRGEKSHRFPVFLPGGGTILFLAQTAEAGAHKDDSAIEALELSSGKRTRLVAANSSPLYSAEGHILFWRDGALMAVSFDAKGLRIDGDPVPIASPVAFNQNEQALATISGEGTLVYREGNRGTLSSVIWLDRKGLGGGVIRDHELLDYMALSNDGTRLAFSVNSAGQGATDLWIQDLARGVAGRFSFEEGGEDHPVWSRDDRFLYYSNDHRNDGTIFRRSADGTGSIEEIGSNEQGMWPQAVSADDRWLVVESVGAESSFDIFRFDMATRKTTPLVTTPFHDDDAALSRDDSLLAYASEQSGRWEVYVQAVGGGHGKWQISSEGGRHPHWSADGREVFFLARPDRIMSVLVEPGDVPHFSAPRELFRQPIEEFGVTPDGQRFVGLRPSAGNESNPMTLISNWTRLIQK
jgi:Tol biopolymer transport system component